MPRRLLALPQSAAQVCPAVHSDSTYIPHPEIPPRSPSPYECEEVVVQNPQSPPVAQSIHHRLAAPTLLQESTIRGKEPSLEHVSNAKAAADVECDTSSRTSPSSHVAAQMISSPFAGERPSGGIPPAANVAGLQRSLATPQKQAEESSSPQSRPPAQSHSHSSRQSGVQSELNPGSAHTKAKFVSIFDALASKPTTPITSKSAAAQVAQGVHPPSLLPADMTRSTVAEAVSPSESTSIRESCTPSSTESRQRFNGPAKAPNMIGNPQQGSTATTSIPRLVIPKSVPRLHDQKPNSSPTSTSQEISIPSGHTSSLSPYRVMVFSGAGETSNTTASPALHDSSHELVPINDRPKSSTAVNVAILTGEQRPSECLGGGATTRCQDQHESPAQIQSKQPQPMLKLVPMPGYISNVCFSSPPQYHDINVLNCRNLHPSHSPRRSRPPIWNAR
jgi:hypothetical protein